MVTAAHAPAAVWAAAHRLVLVALLFAVVLTAAVALTWSIADRETVSTVDVPRLSIVDDRCAEVGPELPC
ncbi:hypothetical protein O2W14_09605 [Modestobacter sp. VKM Ac-2986]|uniref:hypothetical protein n=1 Tax=Modestobacter sp. VKM Ac-2986 TaxID=3004140 RepID=UPI0022AA7ECD|nr:hypothetical protein [Modestobacter sp. VKM Ac-2986]MCZ2829088.1 hypothetical protein [Modestobacter sp. VKM Ac-2986]